MKVLVTGAGGLLGSEVWKLFEQKHEMLAMGRTQPPWVAEEQFSNCDLTNAALTYATITKANPDIVVHCAAYNNVDGAEKDHDAAFRGNALATRNISLACQRFDTTLLSVSTDAVFSGKEALPTGYREFDACDPQNIYAQSKHWAELYVSSLLTKYFIVRTSWLFGPSRDTWVDFVIQSARADKPVDAASDMVSSPTFTPDLAAALLRLAESRHYGIYHLSNQGFCSRVELAQEVLRLHKLTHFGGLRRKTLAELKLPAARPHFSGLENLVWRLDGFPIMRSWQDALADHFSRKKVKA